MPARRRVVACGKSTIQRLIDRILSTVVSLAPATPGRGVSEWRSAMLLFVAGSRYRTAADLNGVDKTAGRVGVVRMIEGVRKPTSPGIGHAQARGGHGFVPLHRSAARASVQARPLTVTAGLACPHCRSERERRARKSETEQSLRWNALRCLCLRYAYLAMFAGIGIAELRACSDRPASHLAARRCLA
jgi:hypothetical protein